MTFLIKTQLINKIFFKNKKNKLIIDFIIIFVIIINIVYVIIDIKVILAAKEFQ